MSTLVTIAIPAYKGRFLRETIASALAQTYEHIEVVVVDDQSPDDVTGIVAEFADTRLHYFRNETNVGKGDPGQNWNRCLQHAGGEFFCLLCDDDRYAPTFVERLLALAGRYPQCQVFRSGVCVTDVEGRETDRFPSSPEWETVDDYMWDVYRGRRRQTVSEFMMRRAAMHRVGGYVSLPYAWGSDNLSIYRFAAEGGIASTAERLMLFRDSGENLSSDQRHMDGKLFAFHQYIGQTRELIQTTYPARASQLLPVIADYYQRSVRAHMLEADARALRNIIAHRRELGVDYKTIIKGILVTLIDKCRR